MKDATLTIGQKILVAAATLPEPFHESDLVVTAWLADKKGLGMKTKENDFPDTNKLRTYLVGERGMIGRGWLVKVSPLVYRLSPTGRQEVGRIVRGDPAEPKRRSLTVPKWPADLDTEICRLLTTTAYRKWSAGRPEQLTRTDAEAWYDGDGEAARELVPLMLADATEYVTAGVALRCGRVVQPGELEALKACDWHLAAMRYRDETKRQRGMRRIG